MVRYLFYTIGDLTYQSPFVYLINWRPINYMALFVLILTNTYILSTQGICAFRVIFT